MPRIFDNIEQELLPALRQTLGLSERSDFCVGYFNLRGWKAIDGMVDKWSGEAGHQCRLLVGMQRLPQDELRQAYSLLPQEDQVSNQAVIRLKRRLAKEFQDQLTFGAPTDEDESGLRRLAAQLKAGKVVVKLFLRHPLHAKLYLCFRPDPNSPIVGFLGSSNLTFAGLSHQGELNVDVLDQGTDRGALLHLDALLHAYPAQCQVSVFQAPARASIFHPKLYIFDAPGKRSIVAGSANLTAGGLGSNFESLIYYQDCGLTAPEARHAEEIWSLFSNPVPPLRREFLKPLTKNYLRALLAKLPTQRDTGEKSEDATFRELWRPLSRVPLPRSTRPKPRKRTTPEVAARRYLVMDVLNETRWTQMQVPIPVVEGFFGVDKRQSLDLHLSILTKTGLSQPIERPLVMSQGQEGQRLMRRIEMPQIRDLERPLAVVFVKLLGRGRFAFKLIPKNSAPYLRPKTQRLRLHASVGGFPD